MRISWRIGQIAKFRNYGQEGKWNEERKGIEMMDNSDWENTIIPLL